MAGNDLVVTGLITGFSTTDIIQKMMDVERLPLLALQRRKDSMQSRTDALKTLNTRLSSLLAVIQKLNLRSTIDVKTVTTDTPSSSSALVTATANSDAALGSFTVRVQSLATATTVTTAGAGGTVAALGAAVRADQPLQSAGFGIKPTLGTFTVNGAAITIDSNTVLSDGTDLVGANTIVAKIRDATAAVGKQVNVDIVADGAGRLNKLRLTAADGITPIQLGSGSDTSNFLAAAGLAAIPSAVTMVGSRNLGAANPAAYLNSSDANLAIPLSSPTGSFKINGVEITYNAETDTLNSVVSRINSSAANVSASYDAVSDRLTLTAKATGGASIAIEDVAGNFLAAMQLSQANESLGASAAYYLNGEATLRYSSSNSVTDAIPGVTIELKRADPSTTVTLTVSQDTSGAVAAARDFVDQYNAVINYIRENSSYDATSKKAGILLGDSTVQGIERTLATLVGGKGDGLSSVARSLSDIGITTGAVGAAVGQAYDLVLDEAKFTAKLQSNPAAVAEVFGGLASNTTLAPGGTGSIASISGTPSNHTSGTYSIVSDASGNLTATFTPTSGPPIVKTGTITAGGVNTTLIPGVTLTAKSTLAAGVDTVNVDFTSKGVGVKIADYLNSLTTYDGVFANIQKSSDRQIDDLNKAIQRAQDRLDEREKALYAKFRALEVAMARLQGQSSALTAQLVRLS